MANFTMSCDDACASDVMVAELAKKYDVECVFYWPVERYSLAYENGYEPLSYWDARTIARDFEIGSHTITHRHLTKLPLDEAVLEIFESKQALEDLFDREITKFCPPRGYTNEELTKRTMTVYDSQRLTRGKGLVHVHPNSGANDNMDWRECADQMIKFRPDAELWFHSWELDKYNLWEQLEDYLKENA